ncbi:MAG TPA: hypothetical protein ENH96_00775 [Chlamydiae bacterium]|nr:hypothetical protein [Candidatus Anoxychlamydiales bacterium]HEU63907.1 hypothetical protein [Chlamydiota bacterium]
MSVENFKISIDRAKNVSEFATLLKDTKVEFTFFGARKVSKENFNKKCSVNRLASKAFLLIRPFLKDWNFSLETRHHISFITKKINKFYEKTDRKRKKRNIITKIFYLIRNIFSWLFQTRKRWDILSLDIDPAIYYTANQYRESFPLNQLPRRLDKRFKNINLYLKPTIIIRA